VRVVTRIEHYPKGTLLLAEGAPARASFLVVRGCVRSFRLVRGEERTLEFFTEFHAALPPTYGHDAPSTLSLECLEDTDGSVSTLEEEQRVFVEHPEFESVCRVMGEVLMARLQETHVNALTRSAKERYVELTSRRPELLQRVPQYLIASYLGVPPAVEAATPTKAQTERAHPGLSLP
jgi:hypothetical protein